MAELLQWSLTSRERKLYYPHGFVPAFLPDRSVFVGIYCSFCVWDLNFKSSEYIGHRKLP